MNGKPAGEGRLTRTYPRHGLDPFEVGRDSITPIDPAYKDRGEFEFSGNVDRVDFELTPRPYGLGSMLLGALVFAAGDRLAARSRLDLDGSD